MRQADKTELAAAARRLRTRTLDCLAHIDAQRERVPERDILNLPVWELGHVGWVHEHWCLRYVDGQRTRDSILPGADLMFDSAAIAHATRWSLALPTMARTRAYLNSVFELAEKQLAQSDNTDESLYFHRLCHFHEAMHLEAFMYTWQTLGYPKPSMLGTPPALAAAADLAVAGGQVELGSRARQGFVFDNEKWAHPVHVAPFVIAAQPLSYAAFAEFVNDGGYQDARWWPPQYWLALQAESRTLPTHWQRTTDGYAIRWFGDWQAMPAGHAVMHVSAHEAQAYCRWAGRRLPTEAEWLCAATSAAGFGWGDSVWEWTATTFEPFDGFSADPYKEYSMPWFGDHRVVRGGSFATPRELVDTRFRNFYLPERADPFLGFRTCAA